jgi:hypothetical protein
MIALLSLLLAVLIAPLDRQQPLAEILRHEIMVLRSRVKGRVVLTNGDFWILQLYRSSQLSKLAGRDHVSDRDLVAFLPVVCRE